MIISAPLNASLRQLGGPLAAPGANRVDIDYQPRAGAAGDLDLVKPTWANQFVSRPCRCHCYVGHRGEPRLQERDLGNIPSYLQRQEILSAAGWCQAFPRPGAAT